MSQFSVKWYMTLMVIWDVCLIEEEIKSHSWRQMSWVEGIAQLPQFKVNWPGLSHDFFFQWSRFLSAKNTCFFISNSTKQFVIFRKHLEVGVKGVVYLKTSWLYFFCASQTKKAWRNAPLALFKMPHVWVPVYSLFVVFVLQGFFLFAGCPSLWPTS